MRDALSELQPLMDAFVAWAAANPLLLVLGIAAIPLYTTATRQGY